MSFVLRLVGGMLEDKPDISGLLYCGKTLQTTLIVAVNMVTKEMAPPVCVSLILLYTALVV
jgi:hypothetical protein